LAQPSLLTETFARLNQSLPGLLADFLADKRWFGGKARPIRTIQIDAMVPIEQASVILLARVVYEDGPQETYAIPLLTPEPATLDAPGANREIPCFEVRLLPLTDALQRPEVLGGLYDAIDRKSVFPGLRGEIRSFQTTAFPAISLPAGDRSQPRVVRSEQSNSSSIFGDRSILKIFRRVQEGVNPELEVGRFLTERAHFKHVAPLGGWIEYRTSSGTPMTLGVLQGFVPNQGDAWQYTLASLPQFWREALDSFPQISDSRASTKSQNPDDDLIPAIARRICGSYLDRIALLGQRTAEMHLALASEHADAAFAPEPYRAVFQQQMEDRLCSNAIETFALLRSQLARLAPDLREDAQAVLARSEEILNSIRQTLSVPLSGMRTRIHGDYHLGQVLCTADDFVIIDFEGEPGRPIADRAAKRSALEDVAGMLRSFQYAGLAPLVAEIPGVQSPAGDRSKLLVLAHEWIGWVSQSFLNAYLRAAGSSAFLPAGAQEIASLLRLHLMAKALFEISYELNNRPPWVQIPLTGVLQLLDRSGTVLAWPPQEKQR
jgi:trehalose synthase-fused probable maltokinase